MSPRQASSRSGRRCAPTTADRAAENLADGFVCDWPCSGERIKGRDAWAEIQRRYPAAGPWSFDVHRIVAEGEVVVTEMTVMDGNIAARAILISEVREGGIARQVEYWPQAYEPAGWRADLVERIEPVP